MANLISTDEVTHEIVRLLKKLQRQTGSMILRVECDWSFSEDRVPGSTPKAKLNQVRLLSGILPGDVPG